MAPFSVIENLNSKEAAVVVDLDNEIIEDYF